MAYSLNLGIEAETQKSAPANIITPANYVRRSDEPEEASYVSVSSTLARPLTVSWGRREIKDIYASTSVDPALRAPARTGVKLLFRSDYRLLLTNTADPTFMWVYPAKISTTVDIPAIEYITADDVLALLQHNHGMIYDSSNAGVTSSKLVALMRGDLTLS
jgi:hypothetical protein